MSKVRPVQEGERIVSHHLLLRRARLRAYDLTALSATQTSGPWRWYVVHRPGDSGPLRLRV